MIAVFLGAGFSAVGGVPLAAELFDEVSAVDRVSRENLVSRVLSAWHDWRATNHGQPEQYLAHLQTRGGRIWQEAQWYVGLVIALRMGRLQLVGGRPTVTRHNINRASGIGIHEEFWTSIFSRTENVSVITTNYDILAERGLRHTPRPGVPRPGFHYGRGAEELDGGGYPSFAHLRRIAIDGNVPLLKLHGSVSWSYRENRLIRYYDCRPSLRGDPAIVAPVTAKTIPAYLKPVWALAEKTLIASDLWLIVGYSLPDYDQLVRELFRRAYHDHLQIHLFNPNESVGERFRGGKWGRI